MDSQRDRLSCDLQQAQDKIKTLARVNSELSRTIQSTQLPEYKQLLTRLIQQQSSSSQTITSLHLRISHLQTQLSFQQKRSNTIISQLQQNLQTSSSLVTQLKTTLQTVTQQNSQHKKQLHQQKSMIKNQQQLIDDYKRSIEEEKQIEREIAKCEMKEIENRMKKDLDYQVQHIKDKHERKLAKINKENISNSYNKQIHNLKQYITAKKVQATQIQHLSYNHQSSSYKKISLTENKLNNKNNPPHNNSNEPHHHILIFDTDESSSQRYGQQKQNSKEISNQLSENKDLLQVFNGIKSLGSTLQSGVHNFKSIKVDYQRKSNGKCKKFQSINARNQYK